MPPTCRLSNMSALVELLGAGSPRQSPVRTKKSSSLKSVKVLKPFLTPKKNGKKLKDSDEKSILCKKVNVKKWQSLYNNNINFV